MLTRLQIDRIEPFADGMAFGTVGSYVRLVGTAHGELDPQHPRNAVAQFISICRWLQLIRQEPLVPLEDAPFSTQWA
jgi:hypothetical protein